MEMLCYARSRVILYMFMCINILQPVTWISNSICFGEGGGGCVPWFGGESCVPWFGGGGGFHGLRTDMLVRFAYIGGIVDHRCLKNFLSLLQFYFTRKIIPAHSFQLICIIP